MQRCDPNKGHFKKNADWDEVDWDGMDPQLKKEFIDFLISSCTPNLAQRGANLAHKLLPKCRTTPKTFGTPDKTGPHQIT